MQRLIVDRRYANDRGKLYCRYEVRRNGGVYSLKSELKLNLESSNEIYLSLFNSPIVRSEQ